MIVPDDVWRQVRDMEGATGRVDGLTEGRSLGGESR